MIDVGNWKKGWALLHGNERRNAAVVLLIVTLSAFSAAAMVASIVPFLSVLSNPQIIHTSEYLSYIYRNLGFESDYYFFVALGGGATAIILLASGLQILRAWAVTRFAMMRTHTISHRLLAAYLGQPYEFFLSKNSSSLGATILAESQQVVNLFFRPAADSIASALTVLAIMGLLLWAYPAAGLGAIFLFGGLYALTFVVSRRLLTAAGKARQVENERRFKIAGEALGGIKPLKLAGRELSYLERYKSPSLRMARAMSVVAILAEVPGYIMQALTFAGGLIFCLLLISEKGFDSGTVLDEIVPMVGLFAFAAQRLLPELGKLYRGLAQVQTAGPAIEAIHAELALANDAPRVGNPGIAPLGLRQELRLEGVTYQYPSAKLAGLDGITLTIRAGQKIGIVGSTGAGKTTLGDVVLGLLRPQAGRIIVDGKLIDETNLHAWQRSVGYVPQDIFMADSSLAENIAFGALPGEVDLDRVLTAASIARVDRFVGNLPEGYDTLAGERGVRLSGGQRQRLGIARALYGDVDLILLDEATSALDNLTEDEVMTALDDLPGGKTLLMIAHRLSTLRACDKIVVLEGGRIAGFDTWEALLSSNETFKAMVGMARSSAD